MNFFKLYIGDYQRDTAHLSVTEHGAYLLMLQHYYATERPLPVGKALHRMLRAQDKAERDAIDEVAAQFWRSTPDGLVNDRADVEITKAGAQAETNRSIAQAREARRKAARQSDDLSTNRATNDQPNQTPDTRHQTEIHPPNPPDPGVRAEDGGSIAVAQPSPAATVCLALRQAGIADVNPAHPLLLALLEAGATAEEFVGAAGAAAGKARGFAYTLAVVEGQRKRAADTALAVHHGPLPVAANGAAAPRPQAESFYERDTRLKRQRFLEMVGRAPPQPTAAAPAPADVVDVTARELPRC